MIVVAVEVVFAVIHVDLVVDHVAADGRGASRTIHQNARIRTRNAVVGKRKVIASHRVDARGEIMDIVGVCFDEATTADVNARAVAGVKDVVAVYMNIIAIADINTGGLAVNGVVTDFQSRRIRVIANHNTGHTTVDTICLDAVQHR